MTLDYNSLLLALGVSSACLTATIFGNWLSRRSETFLLTCAAGLVAIVIGIFWYGAYVVAPGSLFGSLSYVCLFAGFAIIWGAACQFRTGTLPKTAVAVTTLLPSAVSILPMVLGYDGLGFMIENMLIMLILIMTAMQYWMARHEARAQVLGIAALYCLTATSFLLCGAVLIGDGRLTLGAAPNNWAEKFSIAICIAGMTGIGALSLALQQSRLAARHRREAITDPLTGLLNRRALFDLYGHRQFTSRMAVIVFDIDRFKSVNDQYGHAVGDRVLRAFAETLISTSRPNDTVARLGGEEFALVLNGILPGRAEVIAERIRRRFEAFEISLDDRVCRSTTSAGVAFGSEGALDFDSILNAADKALYAAKRNGRNRIELAGYLHAVAPGAARSAS